MENIKLSVNEQKELIFPGLAMAGYKWKCVLDDDTKLKIESRMDDAQIMTPGKIGASRNEIFTITGLQKGIVHATFIQSRNWEPDSEAKQKKEYILEIE